MSNKPLFGLKGKLITQFGTLTQAARVFADAGLSINEARLGRLIHRRAVFTPEEKRVMAWKLQKPISELFAEE